MQLCTIFTHTKIVSFLRRSIKSLNPRKILSVFFVDEVIYNHFERIKVDYKYLKVKKNDSRKT